MLILQNYKTNNASIFLCFLQVQLIDLNYLK